MNEKTNENLSRLLQVLEEAKTYVENGKDIPNDFCRILFPPEKREYELMYYGKESSEFILSNIIPVPLQEDRIFPVNSKINDEEWVNKLVFGENLQVLKSLLKMKQEGKLKNADGTDGIRLIYIDPPFATRKDFTAKGDEQKAYSDKLSGANFLEWLRKRLIILKELLSEDGSIYVHLDNKKSSHVKILLDEIFGESNFRSSIIWDTSQPYVAGNKWLSKNWIYSQATILYYTKSKNNYIFNKEFEIVEQKSGINSKKPIKDVWCDIKNFAGFLGARDDKTGYPTQKPEALLERIINASSNEGDIVLDCFAGSGTTPAVSEKLKRRWIAVDVGKLSIYTIQKRLLNLTDKKTKQKIEINPFIMYSAGLYDSEKLNKFDEENWKLFALQLWGCTPVEQTIKGFTFDGKKNNNLVKVYTPQKLKKLNAKISIETIEAIDNTIRDLAGNEIFIIAPQGQFAFAEDDVDIKDRTYHILRIPYSMLAKFTEDFTAPLQPKDANNINDAVESVGFDFIQAPTVDYEIKNNELIIKNFKSNSRIKGEDKTELSMVLIDYNYKNDTFDLDEVLYSKDHFKNGKAKIDTKKIKDKAMFIFIDSAGNEKKVVHNV